MEDWTDGLKDHNSRGDMKEGLEKHQGELGARAPTGCDYEVTRRGEMVRKRGLAS